MPTLQTGSTPYLSALKYPCFMLLVFLSGFALTASSAVGQQCNSAGDVLFQSSFELQHAGEGTLFPEPVRVETADEALALRVGDLNGDSYPDVVAGGFDLTVLFGQADEPPTMVADFDQLTQELLLADLNQSGLDDIIVATGFRLLVYLNEGAGEFTLIEGPQFDLDDLTGGLAAGDVTGDGIQDVIASSERDDRIYIFEGDGAGGLAEFDSFFANSSHPGKLIALDFDGDGDLDIALSDAVSDSVKIFSGNGAGGFEVEQEIFLDNANPARLAADDINGDSNLDLVVANGSASVGVMIGTDSILFEGATLVPTERRHRNSGIAIGDINGDGHPDILVQNDDTSPPNSAEPFGVTVLYGDETGDFGNQRLLAVGADPFGDDGALALKDFDCDGRLDLIVGGVSSVVGASGEKTPAGFMFMSGVSGRDIDAPERYALPNFSGSTFTFSIVKDNGAREIAVPAGQEIALVRDALSGSASVQTNTMFGNRATGIASGDLNKDGLADYVLGNTFDDQIAVLYGSPDGTFSEGDVFGVDDPKFLAVADLDDDGRNDIVAGGSAGTFAFRNTASGFNLLQNIPISAEDAMLVKDIDFDGKPDIFMAAFTGWAISYGLGQGEFGEQQVFSAEGGVNDAAVDDFDSDGNIDVLISGGGAPSTGLGLFRGLGSRQFDGRQPIPLTEPGFPEPAFGVAASDFDLDGDIDIVGLAFQLPVVLLNDGAGNFETTQLLPGGGSPRAIGAEDVNGDGFPEIVLLNRDSDDVIVFENLLGRDR